MDKKGSNNTSLMKNMFVLVLCMGLIVMLVVKFALPLFDDLGDSVDSSKIDINGNGIPYVAEINMKNACPCDKKSDIKVYNFKEELLSEPTSRSEKWDGYLIGESRAGDDKKIVDLEEDMKLSEDDLRLIQEIFEDNSKSLESEKAYFDYTPFAKGIKTSDLCLPKTESTKCTYELFVKDFLITDTDGDPKLLCKTTVDECKVEFEETKIALAKEKENEES